MVSYHCAFFPFSNRTISLFRPSSENITNADRRACRPQRRRSVYCRGLLAPSTVSADSLMADVDFSHAPAVRRPNGTVDGCPDDVESSTRAAGSKHVYFAYRLRFSDFFD